MSLSVTAPLLKQSRLVELTGRGYSLHQVASALLQEELLKRYPEQILDPDLTMLATPLRDPSSRQVTASAYSLQSLTHAFIQHSVLKTTADYIEGEHFVTLTPKANPPIHLAVSMDDVTALINEHAPFLFLEYQQRQLDYWNDRASKQPRWQELSDLLRSAADVQSANGWDADDCALARFVALHPEPAERPKSTDFHELRVCLLDIDLIDVSDTVHLLVAGALVLTATVKQRERFLMYTVADGYEAFESLEKLGESLPARLDPDLSDRSFKWRLIEPAGNIFDAVAQALVANQLGAIEALDPDSQSIGARAGSGQQNRARFNPVERARLDQLELAIPAWLHAGSIHDLQAYSSCIADLGTLREGADESDDDVPLIKPYAEQKMRAAILADKTAEGAADLPLEHLRITVTNSFETAGFTLPNPFDRVDESLGEFALQNAAPYQASVAFTDAHAVPDWLTVDFLTAIAQQVDIGGQYPQLIKRTLIDDPVRAARQKTRYLRQLPTLLPLLALEYKLKQQGGVDERGYGYVCQLMESITSKQPDAEYPVTIRPLAFAPRRRLSARVDTVTNMFVICPRDHHQGPCLLYRPMLDVPLLQFASLQNLMYALYQPGELRSSVLAWLGSAALSFEYSQYVFSTGLPSPWIVTQLAFEPFMHLDLTGPIDLANAPLTGDILAALYTANSQALIELANRQSQSNSERRWALAADSGWAIFNVAANFLSGAAGTAVWVWQTITQIQQAIDAHERDDNLVAWQSTADVLLTLGMILTQHGVARRNRSLLPHLKAVRETIERSPETEDLLDNPPLTSPTVTPTVTLDPVAIVGDLPAGHLTQLEPGTLRPNSGTRFLAMLDSFQMPTPDLSGKTPSPITHLYTIAGKTCTPVGSRWFQVVALEDSPVYIVDPNNPLRSGMSLAYDSTAGRWHWDSKLRLRGGMPKGRIEALRRAKEQRMNSAWSALEQFAEREPEEKRQLLHALVSLPRDTTEAGFTPPAMRYLDQAMKLGSGYTAALAQLDIWHNAGGGALLHQSQLMRLTVEQHRCLGSWLRVKMRMYANATQKLIDSATRQIAIPRSEHIEIANTAIPLSDAMIGNLETLYRSAQVLSSHSGKAKAVAAKLIGLLPDFGPLDLKANEIGMSYERSVNEQPGAAMLAAREEIGIITANAADAAHELILLSKTAVGSTGQAGRIEQLSQWNDLFASLDERVAQLPTAHPGLFDQARLDRVRTLIGEFHALARERLIAELPEQEQASAPARPEPQPSTSQPRVKVSKSRPRPDTSEQSSESQSSDSADEARFVKLPSQRPRPTAPGDDIELISRALELNLHIDDFNRKTREDARRPGRIPADIRDLFDQQVARLKQSAIDVDMAIARRRASNEDPLPIASLSDNLREGATRTHADGITAYAAMLKQRKPREAYFHWLLSNAQVEVIKDERGRIRTRHRGDYFQEYRILDKANGGQPLWVAHFHYDHMTDVDEAYTAAHLKFADAHLLTLDEKTRQTLNNFDAVDNALRRIVDPQVRDLFLKPQPVKP